MKKINYIIIFSLGFLLAKLIYDKQPKSNKREVINAILNNVNNLSKLVVIEGNFSQVYSFSDSKKYFYDFFEFKKKVILLANAKIEVGYDLSKLKIQIDSINKQIIINKIPEEQIVITPNIKYFDIQESQFNDFNTEELNELNNKSINYIKKSREVKNLKKRAKKRLFEELSKIYQLSKVYKWKVIDNTSFKINDKPFL